MANRIHSKGPFRQEEAIAHAAGVYPGMLVMLNSDGEVAVHATEGGRAEAAFAMEDALQGKTVDDVYTVGTIVTYILPGKGSVVNAMIEDGQDVAIGDHLISAGNGKLKVSTDIESGETLSQVIAVAEEACDLTGSDTSDTLSAVRIL